jgi:drug/metabolite transporter (DMT)-like permease
MKPTSTSSNPLRQRILGIIFVLISAVGFGAMPIFANYTYKYGTDPVTLLFLRFTLASGIMLIYNMFRKARFPTRRVMIILILMGGIGYAGQSFTYFTALLYAPMGTVAILLYLTPAMVTGISIVFFKHKITLPEIIALVLALTGGVLVIGPEIGGKLLGIILGMMAALIYSIYIITGSRVMPNTDVITASTIIMMSAAAVFTMGIFVHGAHFPTHVAGWSAIGAIVVISTVVAIVVFFEGLKRIGPVHSSILTTFEPVVTICLAWIAFNEGLTFIKFFGGVMIMVAGIMLAGSLQGLQQKSTPIPKK